MSVEATVRALARDARDAGHEARAQALARRYRAAILHATPGELPQAQFLCILAAVLGRFVRDMGGDAAPSLATALAGQMRRHADGDPA